MSAPWHVSVLIPARDEEALIARCLHSVLHARAALPPSTVVEVVVAVDTSVDRTASIARDILGENGCVFEIEAGVVGHARAQAAALALARYRGPLQRCWLANTDADCCVPANWLGDQLLFAAEQQVEGIAGTVEVDSFSEHEAGLAAWFHREYLIDADGSHLHVHGANLGVRADAYVKAGGWAALATAEDHDLWRRLKHGGAHLLSTSRTRVTTSGRRTGRAPQGFAAMLSTRGGGVVAV